MFSLLAQTYDPSIWEVKFFPSAYTASVRLALQETLSQNHKTQQNFLADINLETRKSFFYFLANGIRELFINSKESSSL